MFPRFETLNPDSTQLSFERLNALLWAISNSGRKPRPLDRRMIRGCAWGDIIELSTAYLHEKSAGGMLRHSTPLSGAQVLLLLTVSTLSIFLALHMTLHG